MFIHWNEHRTYSNTQNMFEHPEHVLWFDTWHRHTSMRTTAQLILAPSCTPSPLVFENQRTCSGCSKQRTCSHINNIYIYTYTYTY